MHLEQRLNMVRGWFCCEESECSTHTQAMLFMLFLFDLCCWYVYILVCAMFIKERLGMRKVRLGTVCSIKKKKQ